MFPKHFRKYTIVNDQFSKMFLFALIESGFGKDFKYLTTDKGISKEVLTEGQGPIAQKGQRVTVHYTGWLTNGKKFDSSKDRNQPFQFTIGSGVIEGWSIGVATMKVGEKAKFIMHSQYAYGERGAPPVIPPKAILIFEIELLSIDN